MSIRERVVHFQCDGDALIGILSDQSEDAQQQKTNGVLIIVGGPQYRVGSHRQFTLLARAFAAQGIPTLRFDYRGMGDSEGEMRDFNAIDADIRAAIDAFYAAVPCLNKVVLWGLCDAASASIFYAHQDHRVTGMVMINPWVRTEQTIAKTYLKHYYLRRLIQKEFWKKLTSGNLNIFQAGQSLRSQLTQAKSTPEASEKFLPNRMLEGLQKFQGSALIILCEKDLTAQEFALLIDSSAEWSALIRSDRVSKHCLMGANHTFSQQVWREQISAWTITWIQALASNE